MLDGELTTAPLEQPTAILDVGTGTGDWAIAMGERYPDADVTGVDISAMQDTRVPPNVVFEIDNADDEWDRPRDAYDLVHMRNMTGAFRDWSFIYDQAFLHLKPGGWLEMLDFDDQEGFKKFLSVFPPESDLHLLARDLAVAAVRSGRPRGMAHMDPRLLMDAGFVDIKTTEHIIPINIYERHRGSAGKIWLAACLTGLEAVCLRPLTHHMGWDPERLKRVCENVAHEMKCFAFDRQKSKGLIIKLRIVVGRKPPESGVWSALPAYEQRIEPDGDGASSTGTGETPSAALGEANRILSPGRPVEYAVPEEGSSSMAAVAAATDHEMADYEDPPPPVPKDEWRVPPVAKEQQYLPPPLAQDGVPLPPVPQDEEPLPPVPYDEEPLPPVPHDDEPLPPMPREDYPLPPLPQDAAPEVSKDRT